MSQKSDGFAWNFCELYVIEKTQNAFGEFRAANVSSFARPLMTVGRPIQTHGPIGRVRLHASPLSCLRPVGLDSLQDPKVVAVGCVQAVDGLELGLDGGELEAASVVGTLRMVGDAEIGRLGAKVGELTMTAELLEAKIERLETTRPLARRRSRR